MAAAAAVVTCAAIWVGPRSGALPDLTDRAGQASYIEKISATVSSAFKPGLGDHIHCSIFRKYPQNPPAIEEMEEKLGPEYKGLLPQVAPAVPRGTGW